MNLFQRLVFLHIILINKQTFGSYNSDTSLPRSFSCQELAEKVHLKSQFKVINVPRQVVIYSVHGQDIAKGASGNVKEEMKDHKMVLALSALKDDSGQLYVTLIKAKDEVCATRHIIRLKEGNRCMSGDIEGYKVRGYNNNESLKLNKSSVLFEVDFQNKCDFLVGSNQVFHCDSHSTVENSTIQWIQEFGEVHFTIGNFGFARTLIMKMDELDNNTAIVCYQKSTHSNETKEVIRIPIRLSSPFSATSVSSPTYYDESSKLDFYCETDTRLKQYTFLMKHKAMETITKYSGPIHPAFRQEDSGSTLSCVHVIQNLAQVERIVSKTEKFLYKKELLVRKNLKTNSVVTEPPVTIIPKQEQKHLQVGENKTVECKFSSDPTTSTQLQWLQYFHAENRAFTYSTATSVTKYIIRLKIEQLDNNTTLSCVKTQNQRQEQINSETIVVSNSTTEDSYKSKQYYDEETSVECDCSEFSDFGVKISEGNFRRAVNSYLIQVKPNRHNISMVSHEKVTKMNFTKADNNSLLYCLCIVEENKIYSYEVTRHVKDISLLVYREQKGEESQGLSDKSYFYIGGAIIGLIILAVILFIIYWKRNTSKKATSENNNEDPARITYAELELKSVPMRRNTIKVDETPYAEVVLVENKPFLHHQNRPQNTESPYANC